MAVNIFGIFSPTTNARPIPTETLNPAYQTRKEGGVIEISSITFGIENSMTIGSATSGAGAGKAMFKELVIEHNVGAASPNFLLVAATGAHFDQVTFEFVKAGGTQTGKPYFSVACKTVFISKIEVDASNGDDAVTEKITFRYGAMQVNYWTQDKTGVVSGTPNTASWNQLTNQPTFQAAP
jgi:type VI secretion system secreted protein Hcp